MNNYQRNKERAKHYNTDPTMADQSQQEDTDINTIVRRAKQTNMAPGASHQPMYDDFTELDDLRTMIERTRDLARLRRTLPPILAEMPIEQLLALTPEQANAIVNPPAKPPATPKDEE